MTPSGSCGAGLTTTVFPVTSAGAIFPITLLRGTLYEVIAATTPTGARTAIAFTSPVPGRAPPALGTGGKAMSSGSEAPRT